MAIEEHFIETAEVMSCDNCHFTVCVDAISATPPCGVAWVLSLPKEITFRPLWEFLTFGLSADKVFGNLCCL